MLTIRAENETDIDAIRDVNKQAFEQPDEGRIVDALRQNCADIMSLVAEKDGHIVGHIIFSPVCLETEHGNVDGMALGPMAVLPKMQNQGIGSALVREGLDRLKQTSCAFVVLVGHEHFYPRFGFQPASKFGLRPQWQGIPDAAFMVLILDEKKLAGRKGTIRYRPEFDS